MSLITFREYNIMLDEAISEIPTKFGTNKRMDNGKIEDTDWDGSGGDMTYKTSFKHDGLVHHVHVDHSHADSDGTADVSFRTAATREGRGYFTNNDGEHHDAAGTFGKVMHVVHHILDNKKINSFKFSGASPKHNKLYGAIVRNKQFQQHMNDHGWTHKKIAGRWGMSDEHIFKRNHPLKKDA